jgi:hypothetical protein
MRPVQACCLALSALMAAGALAACGPAAPAAAQGKTAADYESDARAAEAEADRLTKGGAPAPAPQVRTQTQTAAGITADGPQIGVYGCMNQDGYETPGLQWGVLDGSTYSTYDGGRGHYVYDGGSQVITFTDGPFKGLRRKQVDPHVFRILDDDGAVTAFACPFNPKDPRKIHW